MHVCLCVFAGQCVSLCARTCVRSLVIRVETDLRIMKSSQNAAFNLVYNK